MPIRGKTVRERLFYEYAKLIADAAVGGRKGISPANRRGSDYWTFVMNRFRRLIDGTIKPSEVLRENKILVAAGAVCAYCAVECEALQWDHLVPLSKGGPDTIDNLVLACASCNREKADRNPIEWYDDRRINWKHIPRLVMGKFLKLVMEEHRRQGTLEASEFPPGESLNFRRICSVFEAEDTISPTSL